MAALTLALKAEQERTVFAQQTARIIRETSTTELATQVRGATAGGDERKLRGIPVLARGCGSAIPGTQPLQALIAKQRNIRYAEYTDIS